MARWTVEIPAHRVAERYDVPEYRQVVGGVDERDAKAQAVRYAHIDAKVPAFRSVMRETYRLARATPYGGTAEREEARVRAGRRR